MKKQETEAKKAPTASELKKVRTHIRAGLAEEARKR
jgi:hypothetical protein